MQYVNKLSNSKGSVDVAMSCVAACWRETEAATVGNATMQHPTAALQQVQQSQIISYVTRVVPDFPRPCCQVLIARLRPCLCCLHTVAPVSECHPPTTEGSTTAWDITQLTYGRWRPVQASRAIYGLFVASQPSLPMLAPRRPPTATHPGWVTSWFV